MFTANLVNVDMLIFLKCDKVLVCVCQRDFCIIPFLFDMESHCELSDLIHPY